MYFKHPFKFRIFKRNDNKGTENIRQNRLGIYYFYTLLFCRFREFEWNISDITSNFIVE